MSKHDLEKVLHASIPSRVGDCNGLFTGLPEKTLKLFLLVQNAAARALMKTKEVTTLLKYLSPYTGIQ